MQTKKKKRKLRPGRIRTILEIATKKNGRMFVDIVREICGSDQAMYDTIYQLKRLGFATKEKSKGTGKGRTIEFINIKPAGYRAVGVPFPQVHRSLNLRSEIIRDCTITRVIYNAWCANVKYEAKLKDDTLRESRMCGILTENDAHYIAYSFGKYNQKFSATVENKAKQFYCAYYGQEDFSAIIFVESYSLCDKILTNHMETDKNQKWKARNKSNSLGIKTEFRNIYFILEGIRGKASLEYIFNPNMGIIESILGKYTLTGWQGIVGDGDTKEAGNVYNLISMSLWKIYNLTCNKENKLVICFAEQKKYLETITENATWEVVEESDIQKEIASQALSNTDEYDFDNADLFESDDLINVCKKPGETYSEDITGCNIEKEVSALKEEFAPAEKNAYNTDLKKDTAVELVVNNNLSTNCQNVTTPEYGARNEAESSELCPEEGATPDACEDLPFSEDNDNEKSIYKEQEPEVEADSDWALMLLQSFNIRDEEDN